MADRDETDWIKQYEPWRLNETPKKPEKPWHLELTKIKGIGLETAEDIGIQYDSLEALKMALKGRVALRNDIVTKLKNKFNI